MRRSGHIAETLVGWPAIVGAALCVLTWLTAAPATGGWFWEFGNALGFAALALMLALSLESGRGLAAGIHRSLAWLAVAVAVAHGGWFLLFDATVMEYLKPTTPPYMAAAVAALLLTLVAALSSGKLRARLFPPGPSFRWLHWSLSVMVAALAGYHVIGSGFYLNTWLQVSLFSLLLTLVTFWPLWRRRTRRARKPTSQQEPSTANHPECGRPASPADKPLGQRTQALAPAKQVFRRAALLALMVGVVLFAPRSF